MKHNFAGSAVDRMPGINKSAGSPSAIVSRLDYSVNRVQSLSSPFILTARQILCLEHLAHLEQFLKSYEDGIDVNPFLLFQLR